MKFLLCLDGGARLHNWELSIERYDLTEACLFAEEQLKSIASHRVDTCVIFYEDKCAAIVRIEPAPIVTKF